MDSDAIFFSSLSVDFPNSPNPLARKCSTTSAIPFTQVHWHFQIFWKILLLMFARIAEYKVLEKIGEGSFSEVLKCLNKSTGALYAAKRLKKFYKSSVSGGGSALNHQFYFLCFRESSILTCAEVVAAQKVPFHANILNIFEYH